MSHAPIILVVDDTPTVLRAVEKSLSRAGYEVLVAESGEDAMEVVGRVTHKIDLFILDITLPGMNGVDLAGEIERRRPGTPVLLMSGEGGNPGGAFAVIRKPFTIDEVLGRVREALGEGEPPS